MEELIRCSHVRKRYGKGRGQMTAIEDVNLVLNKGIFYSIIGKSGAGKSTLLYLLSGLTEADEGDIAFLGKSYGSLKQEELYDLRLKHMGFVFQDYQLFPELTVSENIVLPFVLQGKPFKKKEAETLMEQLSILALADKRPGELSGGEAQRTAIARALFGRPDILFVDEPTGNLDLKTGEEVLNLFLQIHKEYKPTIFLVTHDLAIARSAERLIHIEDGRLVYEEDGVEE